MPVRRLKSKAVAVGLLATHGSANAFGSRDKVAVYWGQNSFGSSGQQAQQSLATYCANTDIDIIPISFLLQMSSGQGGVPVVNFANSGNGCGTFAGTQLLDCPQISKDIQTCQDQYKKTILLSIGGATYTEGGFKTEQAAVNMANLIWNMFGPPGSNAAGIAADMTAMEAPMITSSFGFGNVSTATILARGALPTNTPAEFLSLDTNIAPVLPSSTGLFLNASTGWQSASQSAVTYSDEGVEGDAVSTDPAAGAAAITQLEPLIPGQTTSRTPSSSPRSSTTSSRQTTPSSKSTTKSTTSSSRSSGSLTQLDPSIPGVSSSKTTSSSSKLTATSSKTTTTTSRAPTTSSSVPSPPAMAPSGMTLVTYTFRTTYTSIETKYETRTESIRDQGFTRNLNIDGTATDTAGNSEATSPADDGSEQGTAATVLRPFHSASVDGFDLDIEAPTQNFVPFAKRLRALMNAANTDANLNRQFYLTVAPQCPYPDVNNDAMLNGGVEFDAVFVQFYNNYCGIQSFIPGAATQWNYNFDTWNKWAVNGSANPNVKVFIGVPAGPTAAGSGYLSVANLKPVIEYSKKFSSFGGIMAWDASQAYVNTGFLSGIKAALVGQVAAPSSTTSRSSSSSATSSTTRSTTQSTTASTTRSTTASPSPVTSSLSTTRSTTRSTTQFTTPSTTPSTTRTTTQSTTRSTTTSPTSKTTTATVTTPSNVFSGVPVISSTTASTSAVPSPPTYAAPPPPPSYKEEFRQFVRGLW